MKLSLKNHSTRFDNWSSANDRVNMIFSCRVHLLKSKLVPLPHPKQRIMLMEYRLGSLATLLQALLAREQNTSKRI